MSRQAQNILMGSVACIVAAVAMIAAALALTSGGDDATTTSAIDPLGASQADGDAVDGSSTVVQAEITPRSTLAIVPLASTVAPTTTTIAATTTVAPTTVATTVATTATTVAATTATTATTVVGTETSADGSDPTETTAAGSTETSAGGTDTTAAPATTVADPNSSTTMADSTTTVATTPSSTSLNDIEREIARLTSALRTDPNGPLKRQGAAIDCGGRVAVDLASGQYQAIAALTLDQTASLQVARPWSAQMTTTNFEHQARAGIPALQAAGISVRAAGENIAYHNYSDKAMNHFTGWRESDGHFCNMMDPNFTHIGVGEVTKSDGISYATQNFFSIR